MCSSDLARVHLAVSSLHLLLMLGANVHTLYNHASVIENNVDDFAAFAFVFKAAADYFYCIAFSNLYFHSSLLQHFRGQRHNLHVAFVAQFARHGSKDTCAPRVFAISIEDDRGVIIKADV